VIASATAQRKAKLQQIARHLRLPGRVSCEVRWEYPQHEAIVRQVQHDDLDLVMMESHRHGHIARWLLSNTDWELIRACPCPVWFVRHDELRRSPRILAAIDPMHRRAKPAQLDSELLRIATNAANDLHGSVAVVHACEVLDEGTGQTAKDSEEMIRARLATISLAANHSIPAEECIVAAGEPAAVIAKVVRRDQPDVLVMGALSRSDVGRDVVGRTAERTLDDVDCDVLVVKHASASSARRVKAKGRAISRPKQNPTRSATRSVSATAG
jgi:universal stress protein E